MTFNAANLKTLVNMIKANSIFPQTVAWVKKKTGGCHDLSFQQQLTDNTQPDSEHYCRNHNVFKSNFTLHYFI